MERAVEPKNSLVGEITLEGDKSISHRAIMIGAIAKAIKEVNTARKPIMEPMAITFAPITAFMPERASTVVNDPLTPKMEKIKMA